MSITNYLDKVNQHYKSGHATEHTYRGDLAELIKAIVSDVLVTNEPKRQSCGAPDYILTKKDIPVGFIEAKDIGDTDLEGTKKTGNKEQFDRYKASLNNLIFTDYINFHLYREGKFVTKIAIAEITDNGIEPLPEYFDNFENLIKDFCVHVGQTIKSPKKLAEMMAGKARLLSDIIGKALSSDETKQEDSTLKDQMLAFKEILIHDITPEGFADVYAQTIAYGMFAARLHDPTLDTFSRQEAAELIPKSNPFLRKLFGYIAGPDIDDRIKWVVENLSEIFLACNVEEILKNYGKSTKMEDPIIHFYETFLSEYDPKLRKARGVWYTPKPVVNFIVRAVDDILKTEFDLPQGLADTSKTTIKVNSQTADKRSATGYKQMEQKVHKVQILDPATGTGTFLAEVVKNIHKKFQGQQGIWSNYVESHLVSRLNGFELLMASYAMAHLKLDLLLSESGFKSTSNQRFKVYLTNSLEEHHPGTGTLFANWLSTEANEANHIKRDTPVMCVIGNPPYSVSSKNNGQWILDKMDIYKKGVSGSNKNSLSDDYVKFIRYGQYFIDKNESGILAYISNNSFIDGITHHKMRESLLISFDKIYILDLHGSTKKKERSPDGGADENVFDIQQGVSINIFVKKPRRNKKECSVFHFDMYGKRDAKYEALASSSIDNIPWNQLDLEKPELFFSPFDYKTYRIYQNWISLKDVFITSGTGIKFRKDSLLVKPHFSPNSVSELLDDMQEMQDSDILSKYKFKNTSDWNISKKRHLFKVGKESIKQVQYRPFDYRFTYYPYESINEIIVRGDSRKSLMKHIDHVNNIALLTSKQQSSSDFQHALMSECFVDMCTISGESKESTVVFPLYLYKDDDNQLKNLETGRHANFDSKYIGNMESHLGIKYSASHSEKVNVFCPLDIMDYLYAVLHSPTYREKYKEFLKIDFPRVPYPKDQNTFWQLVKLGGKIRQIHLLESPKVEQYITKYPIDGDSVVGKTKYEDGKVFINDTQYFDKVPQEIWEFYIGGYQPAQKWLKDRKDRPLEYDDIVHYQKIIAALLETDRLMNEIDVIEF